MVWWQRHSLHLAAIIAVLALAACARTAPPAPVMAGGSRHVATRASPRAGAAHPNEVELQPGETLYGLSRRYNVPVRSIIEANGLTPPYTLPAGRRLVLPQVNQHIVQPGETLYSISHANGVDTSTLARTNHLAPPYTVWVGQSLILPAPVTLAGGAAAAPVIQATAPAAGYARPALPAAPQPPAATVVASEALPPPPPPRPAESAAGAAPAPAEPAKPSPTIAAAPAPAAAPPLPAPAAAPPPSQLAALPPEEAAPRNGARTFMWPVRGRILAGYGTGETGMHNDGVNIAAPAGTPVLAADSGVVAYAGNELRGYGNLVLIKHPNGWMTAYAHNASLLVKRGERVRRGQEIARVGATGAVSEPQLHFEIRHGTRALDPSDYLPGATATASRE